MERMLVAAAPYWQDVGWQAHIVGQGDDHPFADDLMAAGYNVDFVRSLRTAAGLSDFAQLLRKTKPDVVHIHAEGAHGPVALVARVTLPRVGLIQTVHNVFNFEGVTVTRRRLQHSVSRLVGTHFVAPSQDVADNERENWGLTCQLVDNWVADEFSHSSHINKRLVAPEAPLRVAIIGNCSEVKNHEVILRAALGASRLVVVHVGVSSMATKEEAALIRQLEGGNQLEMLGARTDVAAILQNAQVYVMPSLHEGMGVALAEALCIGLPCIISDVPGLHWAAGEPGVLVARDTHDWIRLLRQLSDDEGLLSSITSQAQAGSGHQRERFSACRGVTEYVAIYANASRRRR